MTVVPGRPGTAAVRERPDPPAEAGSVLVDGLLLGVCGTDLEIVRDGVGVVPPGDGSIVLGHEALGRVREAPAGSGLAPGDLVAGVVRRPDACAACAADEWDRCTGGAYVELGIKGADGYGATRWRADPRFVVPVPAELADLGVLLEPTSVVAKAWEQINRIGARATWDPQSVLVTGAGPIGLLAALLGVQAGLDVHVLDREPVGAKADLVRDLGATYHHDGVAATGLRPDIALECTGVAEVAADVVAQSAPGAVVCLAGTSDVGDRSGPGVVLHDQVVFGTINAARRHHEQAAAALAAADPRWLARLITRRVPMARWWEALERTADDVKVVVDLTA